VTKDQIAQHIEAAGGTGSRVVIRYRDYLVPVLDDNAEAVKDEFGNTALEHHPLGHMRAVAANVVALIDNHIALGAGPGKPIDHLIPLVDIEHMTPDPPAEDVPPLEPVQLTDEQASEIQASTPVAVVAPSGAEMVASGEVL
jgi:hypothetical protein